jgi:uncharacterized protein (TIGR00730 family)
LNSESFRSSIKRMDIQAKKMRPKKLTVDDIKSGCITLYGEDNEETQLCMIQEELRQGIDMIQSYNKSVTFYGSSRFTEGNSEYERARKIAYRVAKELDYTVLSGGGPGIMEAANRGAAEAGGRSVGLTITLPHEQNTNKYVTDVIPFYFFFSRKISMYYTTEACLYFAGGFGTFDEFFEMLTLKQTGKIGDVPLILVGTEFWNPIQGIIKQNLLEKYKTVSPEETELYTITDDEDKILEIIRNSKMRTGKDAFQ